MSRFTSLAVRLPAALLLTLLPFSAARGAPISYFEAISGDLVQPANNGDPLTTFTLDTGLNTVNGVFGDAANFLADFDSFGFIVPAGLEVLQAKVTLTDATGNIGDSHWLLRAGSTHLNTGTLVESITSNSPGFANVAAVPLLAGDYNISHSDYLSAPPPATANYTFIFDVHPVVPEPASPGALALGALAFGRRRR